MENLDNKEMINRKEEWACSDSYHCSKKTNCLRKSVLAVYFYKVRYGYFAIALFFCPIFADIHAHKP